MRRRRKVNIFNMVCVLTFVMLICSGCGQNHLRKTCEEYETLVDKYVEFVEKYGDNPEYGSYPEDEYMELMEEWAEINVEMEKIDTDDLSEEDLLYFLGVANRTSSKLESIEDGN